MMWRAVSPCVRTNLGLALSIQAGCDGLRSSQSQRMLAQYLLACQVLHTKLSWARSMIGRLAWRSFSSARVQLANSMQLWPCLQPSGPGQMFFLALSDSGRSCWRTGFQINKPDILQMFTCPFYDILRIVNLRPCRMFTKKVRPAWQGPHKSNAVELPVAGRMRKISTLL